MSTETSSRSGTSPRIDQRAGADGYAVLAVAAMAVLGLWQVLAGVAALLRGGTYQTRSPYTDLIDLTVWGWALVLLGVLIAGAGVGVLQGRVWGSVAAVVLTQLSMLVNFALIPSDSLFSLSIIALDIVVLCALNAHHRAPARDAERRDRGGPDGQR